MRFVPIGSDTDFHQQRYRQLRHAAHQFRQLLAHDRNLAVGHFQHQFVVHLQEQFRRQLLLVKPVLHCQHRPLDEIGRGTLHRRVDGGALSALTACRDA